MTPAAIKKSSYWMVRITKVGTSPKQFLVPAEMCGCCSSEGGSEKEVAGGHKVLHANERYRQ